MSEKLKRIEIEAFRIYNEKQIFDFRSKDGEIANLVVIYAPNGYGKTSFFDAIEWSLTGNINRFHENSKIKQIAESEQGMILKNYSTDKEYGTVKLISENDDILEVRTPILIEGYRKTDFKEGKIIEKSALFKQGNFKEFLASNILGQDKIDSFLRFTSPKERYEVLKKFWDSENETKQYQNLINSLKIGKNKEGELKYHIDKIIKEIDALTISSESIRQINDLVVTLNKFNEEKLKFIEFTSDKELINSFLNELLELKLKMLTGLNYFKEKIDSVKKILGSFEKKQENVKTLKVLEVSLSSNNYLLDRHNSYLSNIESTENIEASLKSIYKEYMKFKKLYSNFDLFNETFIEIENKEAEIYKLKQDANSYLIKRIEAQKKVDNKTSEIDTKKQELKNINSNKIILNNVKEQYSTYIGHKKRYIYFENKVNKINEKRNKELKSLRETLNLYNRWLSFKEEEILLAYDLNLQLPVKFSNFVEVYKKISGEISLLEEKLTTKNKEYEMFGQFNNDLNQVINLGRKIIIETSSASCPLCKKEHFSYENLLDKIDEQIGDIFGLDIIGNDIKNLKEEIYLLLNNRESLLKEFKELLKTEINIVSSEIIKKEDKYNRNRINLNQKLQSLRFYREEFDKYLYNSIWDNLLNFFENEEDMLKAINSNFVTLIEKEKEIEERLQYLDVEVKNQHKVLVELNAKFSLNNYQIEIIEGKKIQQEANPVYIYKLNLIKELQLQPNIEKDKVLSQIQILRKKYKDLNNDRNFLKTVNLDLKESVENIDLESLKDEISKIQINILNVQNEISEFENRVYQIFETKNVTKEYIQEKKEELEKTKVKYSAKLDIIEKLMQYTNILDENILRNEKIEEKRRLELEIGVVKKVNKDINEIVEVGKNYISGKINEVFNVSSINTIYQRIDPHPDMKIIQFESNFTSNHPEINIYAQDKEKNRAPVLYFSAAQLNLLSLSIFLARALESENGTLNTIFMDDPVQHLDGLNVLSFIDLLRSITTYKNRQVIISTHNETLFNLIKRKIDPEFTKSKFIKLESFGRIKS